MARPRASYSVTDVTATGATLFGLALVAFLFVALLGFGPSKAAAAMLEPCEKTNPSGPKVQIEGEATLAPMRATRTAWNRSGVRQKLVRPANRLTGRPAFPVRKVRYGSTARIDLKGGLKLVRKGRSVAARNLFVVTAPGKPAWVKATVGSTRINLFKVKGGSRSFEARRGELTRVGIARLTARGAKLLNKRLRTGPHRLRVGMNWGFLNLFSLYLVTETQDPTGEAPEVPPVKSEPVGARAIESAATIKWFVRESFIEYVNSGKGTWVEAGATADPPTGSLDLVYSFNFPFASGWTRPATVDDPENTLIRTSGLVGFSYCLNTINFTASDPEIEIDGDTNSRLIFHVNGTDGTPFPNQRAVMVKLLPSRAQAHSETDNGDGTVTVAYEKIPGFVPAEGTGIFADYYKPFNPAFEGQDPRPDGFGYFSVTYIYSTLDS